MSNTKRFLIWFKQKEKIHQQRHEPPYFKTREIWWCSVGENVGTEINGKNDYFRRPILIIKKLDKYSFLGIPLTGKNKKGSWYVLVEHNGRKSTLVISQIRHFDYRRLDKIIGTLDENDFEKVTNSFINFLKENPRQGEGRGKCQIY